MLLHSADASTPHPTKVALGNALGRQGRPPPARRPHLDNQGRLLHHLHLGALARLPQALTFQAPFDSILSYKEASASMAAAP